MIFDISAAAGSGRQYLFNLGDECSSFTGGWIASACRPPDTNVSMAPTKTVSGTTMMAKIEVSSYGRAGVVRTSNLIDLTNYKTLTFNITNTYSPDVSTGEKIKYNRVGVMATCSGDTFTYLKYAESNVGEVTVDISSISGSYAICLAIVCNRYEVFGSSSITVNSVYLE